MADDRYAPGAAEPAGEVHDDDELADAIAAEFERYATGAVPIVRAEPAPSPAAPVRPASQDAAASSRPAAGRPTGDRTSTSAGGAGPWSMTTDELPVVRRSGYRRPERRAGPAAAPEQPIAPIERILPTGPIVLPEPVAALVDDAPADDAAPQSARHAAPVPLDGPPPELEDPLRVTGPMRLSPGLYEDWEQSLRAIGRPSDGWDDDEEAVPGASVDTATVALRVPVLPLAPDSAPEASSGPAVAVAVADDAPQTAERVEDAAEADLRTRPTAVRPPAEVLPPAPMPEPGPAPAPAEPDAAPAFAERPFDEPAAFAEPESEPVAAEPVRLGRRARRRLAAEAQASADEDASPTAAGSSEELVVDVEEEGIDDLADRDGPEARTAPSGVVEIPPLDSRPRTAPVFVERFRTAILELRAMPAGPTGSRPAAVVARWLGAFASPVVLLAGFAVAGTGAGAPAIGALLLGVLLAVPAVARSSAWAARGREDADLLERAVLGRRTGTGAAAVLLVARIAAAALVLVAAGAVVAAFVGRTGALGLTAATAQVVAVTAVGALALLTVVWPARAAAVLLLLSTAIGAIVTVLLLAVLLPAASGAAAGSTAGLPAALATGFAAVGLLLVLAGADVVRLRTALPTPGASAIGGAVSAVLGGLLLAAGLLTGVLGGVDGAPDDALASALGDSTAELLAIPVAVALLIGAVTLPALLIRSAGSAGARLVGDGSPVRLGTLSAGLLAVAWALGVVASGLDVVDVALTAAAIIGVPVAAWAGALTTTSTRASRTVVVLVTTATAVVFGWLLADGLVPGWSSPVLDAAGLGAATGWRGGPVIGLLAAFVLSALGGVFGRQRSGHEEARRDPADSVEG